MGSVKGDPLEPPPEGDRLQKLLARAGEASSRRKAEGLVSSGRVTVNGRVATLGQRARPQDEVRLDGRIVRAPTRHATYLLHKPVGVLSTRDDPQGRRTVMSLVPDAPGLHPVGRLDMDSEGLLLLTTDGELTLRLTHPRYQHPKRYRVWCADGRVDARALARLRAGVRLEDGPARADAAEPAPGGAVLVLHEGRQRIVRRMLAAVGHRVTRLLRTHFAGLALGQLPPGEWRKMSQGEVERLRYREH